MDRPRGARPLATAVVALLWTFPVLAHANAQSNALRARAAVELYNLEYDRAIATYREAIAADPQDSAAHRGVAIGLWMSISFYRGNLTIDDYLRGVARQAITGRITPPELAAEFDAALNRALALANEQVASNPRNAEAHYQVGTAHGLRASYIATVEGSAKTAFNAARDAYNAQEKVLQLDPSRKDAGLIVGTYRYIVSALSLPMRWVAYMAGFGGGKERGIRMVEEAAAFGGENQDDARFALVLLYNRERQYDQALRQLEVLRARYPRNRLLWLETASTSLRAGRPADAERVLSDGLSRLTADKRPRMFGEEALWHYKRGAALVALRRLEEGERELRLTLTLEGRDWVHARAHLALGKLLLQGGKATEAHQHLQQAATRADADRDRVTADEARALLK
jgi:tetratricopeptide (TPR) repeat protein